MNDFIQKGAQVLVFNTRTGRENPYPRVATVIKVNPKTFQIDHTDAKFSREKLTSLNGHSSLKVTELNSEEAARVWKIHYRESAKSDAMAATGAWNTGHGRDDLELLAAAITALTRYQELLERK